MPQREEDHSKLVIGNIYDVSGEVNIAGRDIYKGFTAEQVSVLLTQITSTFQPKPFDGRCPYKGLDAFEEEDAELFFGREKLVDSLVERVKRSRTLFITGPSGSGKSSLVRAGLLPALKRGIFKNSERWLYETMKPGRDPIAELARVASSFAGTLNAGEEIRTKGLKDKTVLSRWCEIALKDSREKCAVIFVDQFEEVFTQISGETERVAFLDLLTHAATADNGRVIVFFAMRSDFVSNCATYPALNELLSKQFKQIGAMQPDELVSAIAQPALRAGLRIDPDLIAHIIRDTEGEPGALPLTQFALKDLFDAQKTQGGVNALKLDDYLQRGGIHKALERHADHSFAKLDRNEQELARSIFSGLIEIGQGTQDTRRTAMFDELVPANGKTEEVKTIVGKLADARLITTDEKDERETVALAHEKLIDAWPWLKRLVNENRDVIALQNEIASDAKEWRKHNQDSSYLYRGARLANAREKLDTKRIVLSGLALLFIDRGRKTYADELEAARKRAIQLRRRAVYLTVALIIAMLAAFVAVFFIVQSQEQARFALARQLAAQARSIYSTDESKDMVATLLAIQSLRMVPNGNPDAVQVLQNASIEHPITRINFSDVVNSVAFSPDRKYVASASTDQTIRVWEVATGKEVIRMTQEGSVSSVAFSPDGKYVASGSRDKSARVWEITTGKEVSSITHDDVVNSVAFSPDGNYVASGSNDKTVRVWEALTGKEVARMNHDDQVESVTFSPDGKYLASGSYDRTIHVWELATRSKIAHFTLDGTVFSVAFSSDSRYVVAGGSDNTVRVWEIATGKEIMRTHHDKTVYSVAFSPDGRFVVSGGDDHTVRIWEVATEEEILHMVHDSRVTSVAFSSDGKYIVSGSADKTILIWGATMDDMRHNDAVLSVAFSWDGKYIASGSFDKTARVWDVENHKEISRMSHDDVVGSVAFSPDGRYVVSGSFDNTVRVWETKTGKEIARMTHDNFVYSVAFSPDGKYIVSGSEDDTVRVWDAVTGQELVRMRHDGSVRSVAFSPDGRYVVSGSSDNTVRVWEVATGKEVVLRMKHEGSVWSVGFSPDGKYIVSGSEDETVRVWDVVTGQELVRMRHDGSVRSVAFSPDGRYVVSNSTDDTVRVWEVVTETEIILMPSSNTNKNSVAFSPSGESIALGGNDSTKTVLVWLWRTADLIENTCQLVVTRNLTRMEWPRYIGDTLPYPTKQEDASCPKLQVEPEDPSTFISKMSWWILVVISLLCVLFILVGLGLLYRFNRRIT